MKNLFRHKDKKIFKKTLKSVGITSLAFASIVYTKQQNQTKNQKFWEDE